MVPSTQPKPDQADRALLHSGFVLTGVITTLLAPIVTLFVVRYALSDAMVGSLFPAQFFGAKLGNLILWAGLIQRAGFRFTLALGYAIMAAGVGMLGLGLGWPWLLVAVFCYGCGIGVTIPSTHLWFSESNPERRAATISTVSLSWSVGAVLCPAAIAILERTWRFPAFLLTIAIAAAAVSVSVVFVSRIEPPNRAAARREFEPVSGHLLSLFYMSALFFFYTGVENSLSGWISLLGRRVNGANGHWMLIPSFFWATLLAGRAVAPKVLRHVHELRLAMAGLALAGSATCLLIFSDRMLLVYAGALLAGLGLASVYPIAIACVSKAFSSRITSAMFLLSGLGGATLPWLVGMISTRAGSLQAGLVLPLVGILTMLALEFMLLRDARTSSQVAISVTATQA